MELRTKHEAHISTDQTMHNIIMKLKSTELNRNLETKEMASLWCVNIHSRVCIEFETSSHLRQADRQKEEFHLPILRNFRIHPRLLIHLHCDVHMAVKYLLKYRILSYTFTWNQIKYKKVVLIYLLAITKPTGKFLLQSTAIIESLSFHCFALCEWIFHLTFENNHKQMQTATANLSLQSSQSSSFTPICSTKIIR